jgi:flagellin-specific chaperone FliS
LLLPARIYEETGIKTATGLTAVQMLLEKAVLCLHDGTNSPPELITRAQNIVSQIQASLATELETARHMHFVLATIWDALELREEIGLQKASVLLQDFLQTIRDIRMGLSDTSANF